MPQTVLVTGAARPLGMRLAEALLADPAVDQVVGVDVIPPASGLPGVKFLEVARGTGQSAALAEILGDFAVDTVAHLGVTASPAAAGGRAGMKEQNVLGSMQLLAACQRAERVSRLVVRSSGVAYGTSPRDPAMFTEDMEAREPPRSGFARDILEIEGYVRGFARRRPEVTVTTLRLAAVLLDGESPLPAYFSLPLWPTPMGHDARLQFLHPGDAVEVLRRAVLRPADGRDATYNVAGPGVLMLSQAARRAGRPTAPVPAPLAGWVGSWLRRAGLADFSPEQMRYLSYGRVLDCTALTRETGFAPVHSTAAAFEDFLNEAAVERIVPDDLADQLLALLRATGWRR